MKGEKPQVCSEVTKKYFVGFEEVESGQFG
jgi:hypothetical protein